MGSFCILAELADVIILQVGVVTGALPTAWRRPTHSVVGGPGQEPRTAEEADVLLQMSISRILPDVLGRTSSGNDPHWLGRGGTFPRWTREFRGADRGQHQTEGSAPPAAKKMEVAVHAHRSTPTSPRGKERGGAADLAGEGKARAESTEMIFHQNKEKERE